MSEHRLLLLFASGCGYRVTQCLKLLHCDFTDTLTVPGTESCNKPLLKSQQQKEKLRQEDLKLALRLAVA